MVRVTQNQAITATFVGAGLALSALLFKQQAARVTLVGTGAIVMVTAWTLYLKSGPRILSVVELIEKAGARNDLGQRVPAAIEAVSQLFSREGVSDDQRFDALKKLARVEDAGRGIETIKTLETILLSSFDESDEEEGDIGMFSNALGNDVQTFLNDQFKACWDNLFEPGVSEVDEQQLQKMMALEYLSVDDLVQMVPRQTKWALEQLFGHEELTAVHLQEAKKLLGNEWPKWDLWFIKSLLPNEDEGVKALIDECLREAFNPSREVSLLGFFERLNGLNLLSNENLVTLAGNKKAVSRKFLEELFGREKVPVDQLTEAMNNLISLVDETNKQNLAFWAGRAIQCFLQTEPNLADEKVKALIRLPLQLGEKEQYVNALVLDEETKAVVEALLAD